VTETETEEREASDGRGRKDEEKGEWDAKGAYLKFT
jgi:hypothetical protein